MECICIAWVSIQCISMHTGGIHLQSIPSSRSYLDDPPSISEGWGGRVTDYRITVCHQNFIYIHIHVHHAHMSACAGLQSTDTR